MLVYLSVTGIILSIILLLFNGWKFRSSIFLSFFFLAVSMYVINEYAVLYSKSVFFVSLITVNITFASYLIGPMLYWYIRSILTDNSRLNKADILHLLPMMIFLAAALPYILTPWHYKTEIANQIIKDPRFLESFKFTILSEIFPNLVVYLSRPFLVLVYTLWSVGSLIRYLRDRSVKYVFTGQLFMIKWLSFLMGFLLLMVVTHLISIFQSFISNHEVFFTINMLQILSAAGLIGLLVSPLFFPDILYGLPRFSEAPSIPLPLVTPVVISLTEPESGEKTQKYNLESEYILLIENKTNSYMLEFKSFLQPDLNLNRFSDIIQLPVHHLAYYFREIKKQTFNDYCNKCRVEYAKKLMFEGKTGDLTLEALGILSGFTNRSTFFRAFKKAEDISPGSYLSKMNKN